MKKKCMIIASILVVAALLTGCGEDPELTKFKKNFEDFCDNVSTLDSSINSIDPESDDAVKNLLKYIDQLENEFDKLADMDFPKDFDYLEELADQAYDYMEEAASSYHEAYADGTFQENVSDYALKNYKRAYKRIQIILIYLHGDEPTAEDLITD